MTCRSHKLYLDHGFDTRRLLDTYFSSKSYIKCVDDSLKFPIMKLHNILKAEHIKGNILTDISIGSFIHHLYSACEFFKEIIVLRFTEGCMMELNKWWHDRTGAYDWSHTADIIKQVEGERAEDKEMKLKTTIKHIVKCDLERENLTDPLVLPQADCLISAWLLECISKDKEDFIKHLKKFLKCLKPGGHLILLGVLNGTYYTVGEQKFHILKYDENFLQKALTGEGLTIDDCEVLPTSIETDLTDYKSTGILVAHKIK